MTTNDTIAQNVDPHRALQAYIAARYAPADPLLEELLRTAAQEGMPAISVPPAVGRLLGMLVRISGTRRILEVGTLAGYSAICMARALPAGGRLISLEVAPKHAQVAGRFVAQAGLSTKVEIRVGPALDSLAALAADERFDLMFIDANKDHYPEYLDWALKLVRPGGLILADNALSRALVPNQGGDDADARGIQTYNDRVAHDPRLEATILLTRDGLDGLSLARVRDERTHGDGTFAFE